MNKDTEFYWLDESINRATQIYILRERLKSIRGNPEKASEIARQALDEVPAAWIAGMRQPGEKT